MSIETLKKLEKTGELNELYQSGLISIKPFMMLQFFQYCEANSHKRKTDLVFELSIAFKCSERLVYMYLSECDR